MHVIIKWASSRENQILLHAKNKGADQPAHLCSLISTFVIRSLPNTMAKLATCKISKL